MKHPDSATPTRPGWGLALALLLLAFAGVARAAAPADTLRLSLPQCVSLALARGEEMQLAEASYDAARAAYQQARSVALPQLSLSAGYTRTLDSVFSDATGGDFSPFEPDTLAPLADRVRALEDALPMSGLAGLAGLFSSTSFGSENTWTSTLSLSQKLFEGGSIWHSIAAARHALLATELLRADRREEVILQVREAYLGALLAGRGLTIAELALAQAESQLERVRLRAEAGQASEFALLQAEVQRDNQLPAVLAAKSRRELAQLELARLVNLPADQPLALTTPLLDDAALPAGPALADTTGLVALALRASGLIALEEALQAREHAVGVAASGKWPGLSLFANYTREAYPAGVFPGSDDWRKDVRAGLLLNWSLFDGLRTRGAVQDMRAKSAVARHELRQARELIAQGVRYNQWELHRAAADLHARSRTVALARRAHELASLRYDEGASDLIEVSDARIALQLAQMYEAQARHDTFVALARLERYSGQPLLAQVLPAAGN
ncbi:TolC family protein [bacterium]|nr:TolC family protein [bacterium]